MDAQQAETSVDQVRDPSPQREAPARRGAPRRRRRPRRRRLLDRITVSTVVGLVAALLVFVLTAVLLRDRREMVEVAVASERIPAGTTITASMVEAAEVPASVSFVDGLVRFDDVGASVAVRTVQRGEAIARSAIGAPEAASGARVMAIPLASWAVAGGELDVGDQVDVIDTGDGGPRFVLSGAAVVARASDDDAGGLVRSSSNELWIAVEVTAAEALALASVIERDEFVLVRSTGATDVPPAPADDQETSPSSLPTSGGVPPPATVLATPGTGG